MTQLQDLVELVVKGETDKVKLFVADLLQGGVAPKTIMDDGLVAAMNRVGELMEAEDLFLPEVFLAAEAMNAGVQVVLPHIAEGDRGGAGTVVIGTVKGDLHDIGKNIVKMLLESTGFKVVDLGTDVKPADFVEAVQANQARILALSALLTTTMPVMKEVVESLKSAGIRDKVAVLIGGAPVSDEYATTIGADAYGPDAGAAVRIARAHA